MRPVLSPAVRRLWRDPETLQLGRGPGTAVVLAGLDPAAAAVLALLDGTRDLDAVRREAVAAGCPAERADALLGLLQEGGLVVDAAERWPDRLDVAERDRLGADVASLGLLHGGAGLAALRRRDAASVVVVGAGRVGAPLAALLAAAGVGTVDVVDPGTARARDVVVGGLGPGDVGRPRGRGGRATGCWPGRRRPATGPVPHPDLVVLAPVGAPGRRSTPTCCSATACRTCSPRCATPSASSGRWCCRAAAPACAASTWPGPTATPAGRPSRRSCPAPAGCRRPATGRSPSRSPRRPRCRCSRCSTATPPATVGGSLELALPGWRWRRRSWTPHPACECRWQAGA